MVEGRENITAASAAYLNNRLQPHALQRPLLRRFRFQARLSRSVAMTSDVKGWEQLVYVRIMIVFPWSRLSEEPEPVRHDG